MKCIHCGANLGSSSGKYDLRVSGWVCKNKLACAERQADNKATHKFVKDGEGETRVYKASS